MSPGTRVQSIKRWLPLGRTAQQCAGQAGRPGTCFRSSFIDLARGIRVGHLDEEERITWILKERLRERFGERFVIDRWGRGVYWQYVWFTPERNWQAKRIGGPGHFASAKYFISVNQGRRLFQAGLFIESGHMRDRDPRYRRSREWDWHRFLKALSRKGEFQEKLKEIIVKDGFQVSVGFDEDEVIFDHKRLRSARDILKEIRRRAEEDWTVVSIYYPTTEKELKATPGPSLIDAVMAVFNELLPLANRCLQVPLAVVQPPATPRSRD